MKKTVLFLMIMTSLSICACSPIHSSTPERNKYSFEGQTSAADEHFKQYFLQPANNTANYAIKHPVRTTLKVGSGLYILGEGAYWACKCTNVDKKGQTELNLYSFAFIAIGAGLLLWFAHDVKNDKSELPDKK